MKKFPLTSNIAWGNTIEPKFKNISQKSETGERKVIQRWIYPEYRLSVAFKALRGATREGVEADVRTLLGFFLDMTGSKEPFLWKDDTFNHADHVLLGVADGMQTTFQLKKQFANYLEPVLDVENVTVYGTSIDFSVNELGQVVFISPPPKGTLINVSFDYYWRVRFASDTLSFKNLFKDIWEVQHMELVTVK